jgi:hypothetical protein
MFDANTTQTLLVAGTGAAALGLGFGTAARMTGAMLRELKAARGARGAQDEAGEFEREQVRDTLIAGLFGNVVRCKDGGYIVAFHVELDATMLAEDSESEDRCKGFARLLASDQPPGTVIQFRRKTGTDPGVAIASLYATQARDVHPLAAQLRDLNLQFHGGMAAGGAYRLDVGTIWVKVPHKHRNDYKMNPFTARVADALGEIRRQGARNFIGAVVSGFQQLDNGVVTRMVKDELESLEEAERFFEQVADQCPVRLRRFTRTEVFKALYYGHNFDAESCPVPPLEDGEDITPYLCGETIRGNSWFLMHGSRPVTLVSMTTPPNDTINELTMRRVTTNGALNFEHVTVTEYVALKKEKAVKRVRDEIKRTNKSANKPGGGREYTAEQRKKLKDCEQLLDSLTDNVERMVAMRHYAVIFGDRVKKQSELEPALRRLEKNRNALMTALREVRGVEVRAEDPEALRALYPRTLVGEFTADVTGREIAETTDTLAPVLSLEDAWRGAARPHTVMATVTNRLRGVDLTDDSLGSQVIVFLGQKRSGKSSLMAQFLLDILAHKRRARAFATDYGLSLKGVVRWLKGHLHRFNYENVKPINFLDYRGLAEGLEPDEKQLRLMVEFVKRLLRVKDEIGESILYLCVKALCKRTAGNNSPGEEHKYEATLSGLIAMLDAYPFEDRMIVERASQLKTMLQKYEGHPWLDAKTHEDYKRPSVLTVFELKDLEVFPDDVRDALAFTIMARITSAIGELDEDGHRNPTIGLYDEIWRYRKAFPAILDALKIGARTGGKENFITMLGTHGQEDLQELYDITKTAGVRVIGKQSGDFSLLAMEAKLSHEAVLAVKGISNVTGKHRQYVIAFDFEEGQVVEMFQNEMSPALYWIQTNNPRESNAKETVERLMSPAGWEYEDVITWLAAMYPRGLARAGVTEIDPSLLPIATEEREVEYA